MIVVEHRVTVELDGQRVPVIEGWLRVDETRTPRITAQLVVPATPALLDLDPQAAVRWVTVQAVADRHSRLRLRDLSTLFAGFTLADLTALFTGKTLGDIPDTDPGGSWRLHVRRVTEDWAGDTVTLTLASCEAIAMDFLQPGGAVALGGPLPAGAVSNWTVEVPTTSTLDAVNRLLAVLGLPAVTDYDPAATGAITTPGIHIWGRGQSAWDKLLELARAVNLLPIATGDRIELRVAVTPGPALTFTSTGDERNLTGGGQWIDRDAVDFAHVLIGGQQPAPSTATDPDLGQDFLWGNSVRGKLASVWPGMPWKGLVQTFPLWGGWATMLPRVKQAVQRGRGWNLTAISDYRAAPSSPATIEHAGTTVTGVLSTVEFRWPANEMALTVREALPPGLGDTDQIYYSDWWA